MRLFFHFPVVAEKQIQTISDLVNLYPHIDGFRFNHVVSASGTGISPSDAITSQADRFVLKAIRSVSDLIVTTGRTARAEQLIASSFAPLLILTRQATIDAPATTEQSIQKVYITCRDQRYVNLNAISVGEVEEPLDQFLNRFCAINSFRGIVLETGLLTLATLLAYDVVDEICLTVTSAKEKSESDEVSARFLTDLDIVANLVQLIQIEGDFFYRFALTKPAIAS